MVTIGGGTVLHIPRLRLRGPQAATFLELQERGLNGDSAARAAALEAMVCAEAQGSTLANLVMRTGWSEDEIRKTAEALAAERRLRIFRSLL